MSYYKTCPLCGSNLDPGEACDCHRKAERSSRNVDNFLKVGIGQQTELNLKAFSPKAYNKKLNKLYARTLKSGGKNRHNLET